MAPLFQWLDKQQVMQLDLHAVAAQALAECIYAPGTLPREHQYYVYTDGSLPEDSGLASWAGIILGSHSGSLMFHGALTSLVSDSGMVCQQAKPSSTTSECAGLLWLML